MMSTTEGARAARAGRSLGLRFAAVAFAACLAFVLASCGGEEKSEPSDQGEPAAAATDGGADAQQGGADAQQDSGADAQQDNGANAQQNGSTNAQQGSGTQSSFLFPTMEEPDEDTLYALLDEEAAQNLIERAKTDPDTNWIAAHPDEYGIYGYIAQTRLLEIAARDPLAAPYIRQFLDSYPADGPDYNAPALEEGSPSPDVPETKVPHLYQWDQRWGYVPYGGFVMGTSACGPTALTMVYQAVTGDKSISPYDMALKAYEWGYVSEYGTSSAVMYGMVDDLGMECWEIPATAEGIVEALQNGYVLIDNVGIGYFSTSGHFLVLTGLSPDGQVIMNDPFSITRSSQLWDPEFIASESMSIYAYKKA